jgi:hypothetical protein
MPLFIAALGAAPGSVLPEGVWEGEWKVPACPYFVQADFARKEVRMDVAEDQAFTMKKLVIDRSRLQFEFDVGDPVQVSLEYAGDELRGTAKSGGDAGPVTFHRMKPPPPRPGGRLEAWQQDLDVLMAQLPARDRSFTPVTRKAFEDALRELRTGLASLSDAQITAGVARAIALANNGHTRLRLYDPGAPPRLLPLAFADFADGVFVVSATRAHRELLGCRVTEVAGRDVEGVLSTLDELSGGLPGWRRYVSTAILRDPAVLNGVGVTASSQEVPMKLQCKSGAVTRALAPVQASKDEAMAETWWSLVPGYPAGTKLSASALERAPSRLPLYLKDPADHYTFQRLRDSSVLYFRYNQAVPSRSEPLAALAPRLLQAFEEPRVNALVVDLRFNSGGNLFEAAPLMERLRSVAERRHARVFVIVSPITFSAGIYHAAQLARSPLTTLVGEAPGDAPDFWAEGGDIRLPNSRLRAHYSSGFHSYSGRPHPDVVAFQELEAGSLEPRLPVRPSFLDYASGRDAVLDAIRADLTEQARAP